MKKDDTVYLKHILDAATRIEQYIAGVKPAEFIKNLLLQDGVIRQTEIIGEATAQRGVVCHPFKQTTKKLSSATRAKYPQIPWKDIAGMRDKLIHDYLGVDIDAVWDTAHKDIPALKKQILQILTAD